MRQLVNRIREHTARTDELTLLYVDGADGINNEKIQREEGHQNHEAVPAFQTSLVVNNSAVRCK